MMGLEETVADLTPRILRYCVGRTGCRSLGEDVAQEALTALISTWRRHGAPRRPDAFVFAIARRRCARATLRRRLMRPLESAFGASSPSPPPDDVAESRDELAQVSRALARLGRRDREVLLLVAAGEVGLSVAADLLGISVSAAKMRLHRARQRLSQMLEVDDAS